MAESARNCDYTLLLIVVKEGHADRAIEVAQAHGAHGATTLLGKGCLSKTKAKFFGMELELGRQVIFMAVKAESKSEIMQAVYDACGLKTEAHGLVFELPLSAAAGIAPVNLLDRAPGQGEEAR